MNNPLIDIVATVWNRPVETRNCLVSLINHSPDTRFILVDNGSDRETERMLQDFAEILDHRAVLLRNNVNQGHVRAINKGLAHSEAPYIAIFSNTSIVTDNWLEPLIRFARERSEAGIIVPRLIPLTAGKVWKSGLPPGTPIEADHGSLSAMLFKKQLYDQFGGFDEDMDGGLWCLRDFTRRAYRALFLTFRVDESVVCYEDEIRFGSLERREIAVQRSIMQYRERWGAQSAFCVHMPKGVDLQALRHKLEVLLQGARHGHVFTLLVHAHLYKELASNALERFHENIRFVQLPLMFETKAISKAMASIHATTPGARAVTGIDNIPFPAGIHSISFEELKHIIATTHGEKYGGKFPACGNMR
jgi:glycosyltransferase involved in cell wall biosynthesis